MSEDIADRLRQLARDHSEGRLGLLDYRRLRAPLLDFLVARRPVAEFDAAITTRPRFTAVTPETAVAPETAVTGGESAAPAAAPKEPTAGAAPAVEGTGTAGKLKLTAGRALADAPHRGFLAGRFLKLAAALLALVLIALLSSRYHWVNR